MEPSASILVAVTEHLAMYVLLGLMKPVHHKNVLLARIVKKVNNHTTAQKLLSAAALNLEMNVLCVRYVMYLRVSTGSNVLTGQLVTPRALTIDVLNLQIVDRKM